MRNGLPESWHSGAVAAVTPEGRLVASLGDPEVATFLRSAAKPFQCLPLLLAGGEARFGLDAADIALTCASHGGTPAHVRRAGDLLARGGFGIGDLLCGAHPPMDAESARRLVLAGAEPTPLHNNCSGKHAGMLLACRLLGLPTKGYIAPDHPLQRRALDHTARFCGVAPESIGLATDGCSVPTYHLSLAAAARGYAALAHPEAAGLDGEVAAAVRRVVAAMTGAPEVVAGPGRFTTRLMEATGGRVLGKEGAEGFYGVAVRGPVALGIAVKIADGGERCRDGVVLDVLRQLGSLSGAEFETLAPFYRPRLVNWAGLPAGEVRPDLELEEAELEEAELEEEEV
ncbi:MAG TPA: asparaginase [Thermoanaerobaculia bacterium]|nr:asparaginase [Thermoanaerobaculia bacterium]